jgi:hypothetical protein
MEMENVVVVGCRTRVNNGYGCPGEWRCLKAVALGDEPIKTHPRLLDFSNESVREDQQHLT